jgi:hypothetical protein
MQRPLARALLAGTLALLAACSSTVPRHESDAQQRARYASYAGAPQDSFTWLGRYYSWDALGDNHLVLFTTPNDAYLITVQPPCTDLDFAQGIGLTATGSTVHARLDSVIVKGWRCPINEIRKVDYTKMRADMRAEADQGKSAPPQSKGGT